MTISGVEKLLDHHRRMVCMLEDAPMMAVAIWMHSILSRAVPRLGRNELA